MPIVMFWAIIASYFSIYGYNGLFVSVEVSEADGIDVRSHHKDGPGGGRPDS
jgi:hypothetical protein